MRQVSSNSVSKVRASGHGAVRSSTMCGASHPVRARSVPRAIRYGEKLTMVWSMSTIRKFGSVRYSRTSKLGWSALRLRSMPSDWVSPSLQRNSLNRRYASEAGSISRNRTDPPWSSSRSSSRANRART